MGAKTKGILLGLLVTLLASTTLLPPAHALASLSAWISGPSSSVRRNQSFTVKVTVYNSGNTPAYNLEVTIYMSGGLSGKKTQYLYKLNSGSSRTFSFSLKAPSYATTIYIYGQVKYWSSPWGSQTVSVACTGSICVIVRR